MTRIAIAGFQHESNSFAANPAELEDFLIADSWPGLLKGDEVITGTRGMNLPIAGFVEAAEAARGIELLPILWGAAEPSAPVADTAFETIMGWLIDGLKSLGEFDALYLDLHGAMITASHEDGEAEILRRIRAAFGTDLPIAISLDMHANLAPETVALADVIRIFRTYPHLDMAETGARCLDPLLQRLQGARQAVAFRQVPYLIPLHAQFTGAEPVRGWYQAAIDASLELAVGFTAGDCTHCGPSIVSYAAEEAQAEAAADALLQKILADEARFDVALPGPHDAVRQAMALTGDGPVVIADVEDNPGGGGSSDTTGLLRALVDEGAQGALLGLMHDPDVAADAHRLGQGAEFEAPLGGRAGPPGEAPFPGRFRVEALSDGRVVYEGEMYGGGVGEIGKTALLRVLSDGVDLCCVVSSTRNQCLDRAYFRHLGAAPEQARILAVKSTVHFRADFEPMARAVIPCAVPGLLSSNLAQLSYQNLRPGVRLGPNGAHSIGK